MCGGNGGIPFHEMTPEEEQRHINNTMGKLVGQKSILIVVVSAAILTPCFFVLLYFLATRA